MGEGKVRREEAASDRDDFVVEVERVLDAAYRMATVMLLDYAAAEEAVHAATLAAWSRYGRPGGDATPFLTWFLAVVVGECRGASWRRRLTLRGRGEGPEASDLVADVLLHMDVQSRIALFCHYFLQLREDEVAVVLGVSPTRVLTQRYRAEERLQADLVEQGAGGLSFEPDDLGGR
jgi:DNA-directed RNA polymerase specialized sigma24 family protein